MVKESQAKEQYEKILAFVQDTGAEGASVIPISVQLKYKIEVVFEYTVKKLQYPQEYLFQNPDLLLSDPQKSTNLAVS